MDKNPNRLDANAERRDQLVQTLCILHLELRRRKKYIKVSLKTSGILMMYLLFLYVLVCIKIVHFTYFRQVIWTHLI